MLFLFQSCSGLFREGSLSVVIGLVSATVSLQVKVILASTEVKEFVFTEGIPLC